MTSNGPVAIVTGAGTGIGAATARLFAANGISVVLVGRREAKLREVAQDVEQSHARALVLPHDLGDPNAPQQIVETTLAELGRIDVLVNNAATIKVAPFPDYSLEDVDQHLAVNIRSVFLLTQAALPALQQSEAAAVVNISSSVGKLVKPQNSLYGITKAALEYLTRTLALELAPERIRVNALALGPVDTPIHEVWADDLDEAYDHLRSLIPLGQMGTAEEVAEWIYFLAANSSASWLTGAVIPLDGGQTLV